MRIASAVLFGVVLLTVAARTGAQERDRLAELEARVKALESKTDAGKAVKVGYGDMKIGLLLQMRAVHDDTPGTKDAFSGRRAEVKLSGHLVPEKIGYVLKVDPVSLTGAITQDFYLTLSYIRFAEVWFGQFKYPQGLEGRWSSADLDFIRRSVVAKTFGDKRDFGAELFGTEIPLGPFKAEYAAGFFNGSGRNTAENNEHKDFAAWGGLEWSGLWIGVNGYAGKEPLGNRDRFGTEARWKRGGFKLQGEWQKGRDEPAAAGLSHTKREGYYALANYRRDRFRPGVRWESWDPDTRVSRDRQDALTLGLDLFAAEDHFRWSLNYAFKFEEGAHVNNDEVLAQFQINF